ncbi:MAG: 5'/3'-nucleotidase SurE [Caldilineaceae bacterium]|nr:5'/3'-nucleotidase SurE [Caldilineaceae bacterium]
MSQRPLILITNDDGIRSRGLLAAASACDTLGDLLIVAPAQQQSAIGRAKPPTSSGRIFEEALMVNGRTVRGYAVEGTPAQAVEHAVVELADRQPVLAVSGINFGENLGEGITTSGTVGAAIEAASLGIPALATSLQTDPQHYFTHDAELDFAVSAYFVQQIAAALLTHGLPPGVDLLKIDLPSHATLETPIRWTRLSRQRYFYPVPKPRQALDEPSPMGFVQQADPATLAADSDVRAVVLDRVVSVTPLVLDMTAPIDLAKLDHWFNGHAANATG